MNPTQPSNTSPTALYISNWKDLVGIWKASKLTQLDTNVAGPRLGELRYLRGSLPRRTVNQIVDYTGFFRDESNNAKFTQVEHFDSEAWFENAPDKAGTLTTNYLTYNGAAVQPRLQISRSFVAPPSQPFLVVRYTLTNPTNSSIIFNVLDMVHLNNLDHSQNVHAWFDATNNVMLADMTASGQLFVFLGALQAMDGHQVANDADTNLASPTACGWCCFDASGTLRNNQDVRAADVDLSFNKRITVAPGQTQKLCFYLGVCETQSDANSAITAARSYSGDAWFSTTATAYTNWLTNGNQGTRVNFADAGLNNMFERALFVIKNVQNPVSGSFAATTNPFAYGYKNWVRDSGVTSIALDAAGHHAEAEKHIRWLAGVQSDDGTWKTTYDTWDSSYVPFVEPEFDSIGTFIYSVYRHYTFTADSTFLNDLWPNVKKAADWILANIAPNGFGKADYSIWEEDTSLEHNSYTLAW